MTKEELASKLNGIEYMAGYLQEAKTIARESGLVIVSGDSDDLMCFNGAISDEFDCYEGGTAQVDKDGLLPLRESADLTDTDDDIIRFFTRYKTAKAITAEWARCEYAWSYQTAIPHASFDIMEDGSTYCQGIIFSLEDLG